MFLRRWWLTVLIVCGGFASPSALGQSASGEIAGKADSESENRSQAERFFISTGQDDRALAALRPDQAAWLETDAHGRVLALIEREQGASANGAVIIVGDAGQTADTGLTGALREPLATSGWAALSLGLPHPPDALLQTRESAASDSLPASSGSVEKEDTDAGARTGSAPVIDVMGNDDIAQVRDAYRARLTDILATARRELGVMGYSRLLLVGIGRGADAVTSHTLAQGAAGLVWVVPDLSEDYLASLAEGSAGTTLAILDLVSSQDRGNNAADRRSRVQRGKVTGYQQQRVAMPARPMARDARQIAQRILGWARSDQ